MDSPMPSNQSVSSGNIGNVFRYQSRAILALLEERFDHNAMMAIARLFQEQGREGVDSCLNQFLHAIKGVPIDEVSSLIRAVEMTDPPLSPVVELAERSVASPAPGNTRDIIDCFSATKPNKRRCREARFSSLSRPNTTTTRSMQFSTVFCTELDCNKVYSREGHFVNHFQKHHRQAHHLMCCHCSVDFRAQGIEAFAKHIWANHMDTLGFSNEAMPTRFPAPRQKTRLLSDIHSRLTHPVFSPTQISPKSVPAVLPQQNRPRESRLEPLDILGQKNDGITDAPLDNILRLTSPTTALTRDAPPESSNWNDSQVTVNDDPLTDLDTFEYQLKDFNSYQTHWQQ